MRSFRLTLRGRRPCRPLVLERLEDRVVPAFVAPLAYDAGHNPSSMVAGHFTDSGHLDLAVVDAGSNNVSVLLGNGDGTFRTGQNYRVGQSPSSVAVGDFTGNGILDLAVGNTEDTTVSVLLGNGDGSFQNAQNYSVPYYSAAVAVGDFTGNGILDLAVANVSNTYPATGVVSVLLGNGDGSFQPARNFDAGGVPRALAAGHFTGDGHLDLAVVTVGFSSLGIDPRLTVLLGNGDGTFQPAQTVHTYSAGDDLPAVAVGDFTGNGILDLAVANQYAGTVSVFLGNGDGSFQPARDFDAGSSPVAVAVGDFNRDGILDLAVGSRYGGTVSVLLGNGDGSFQPARNFTTGGAQSVVAGDFTGDGILDFASTGNQLANGRGSPVSVLLGNGDGSFQEAPTYSAGPQPDAVAVGDFTGSGIPDLVVANSYDATVSVLLGNGDGSFQPAQSYSVGYAPQSVVVGDFTGSGILDLAVANLDRTVSVLLGNGDGSFQAAQNYSLGNLDPYGLAVGDFTGSGILDVVVVGNAFHTTSGFGELLLGNGDGSFQPARSFFVPGAQFHAPLAVAVGDFNGDGNLDLALPLLRSTTLDVLLGNGDGTFGAAHNYTVGYIDIDRTSVAVGNFSGSSILDVAVTSYDAGTVSVLSGNGDGTFQAARTYSVGANPVSVAVGDFNGDGILDLAVANVGDNTVSVLPGNGDGSFQPLPVRYIAGRGPSSVAVGDFNGDGRPDLAIANEGSNDVSILLNDGAPRGRGAPVGGRLPGTHPRPRATQTATGLLAEEGMRPDSVAAIVPPPVASVPVGDGGLPPLGADAAKVWTVAAPVAVSAQAPTRAWQAPRWLLDRLIAEMDSGWLWDSAAD
jgi:hypothetical protein